jgi:hypothetical protein
MFPLSNNASKIAMDEMKVRNSSYVNWLGSNSCELSNDVLQNVGLTDSGVRYMATVHHKNRRPHRWGWKSPKNM